MKLGLVGVNLGDGQVGRQEEGTEGDENAEVPPRVTPEVFEREVYISVTVDVRLARDRSNDRTSLVLDGGSLITSAGRNKGRACSL